MPEIPTEIATTLPQFYEGLTGTITAAELVTTQQRGFKGVRIVIKDDNNNEYAEILWLRDKVGTASKLGAFIDKLGKNTDSWLGQRIKIVSWKPKDREIAVVKTKGSK